MIPVMERHLAVFKGTREHMEKERTRLLTALTAKTQELEVAKTKHIIPLMAVSITSNKRDMCGYHCHRVETSW